MELATPLLDSLFDFQRNMDFYILYTKAILHMSTISSELLLQKAPALQTKQPITISVEMKTVSPYFSHWL